MASPDGSLALLARAQHGAFTVTQALAAGFTVDQVRHRVTSGLWERRARGVFAMASTPPTERQRAFVVLLARPGSVVSHQTAAQILGLVSSSPPRPSITVPPATSGRSSLAAVHRRPLPEASIMVVDGLRVTAPARTIVDCATELGPRRVRSLVDAALHRRATTVSQIDAALLGAGHLGPSARSSVLSAIEVWRPTVRPGSPAEARLLRQLEEWGLPTPARQVPVADPDGTIIARIDAGWPDRRFGLEYDGIEWHGPMAWASDEARHDRITRSGWRLLHVHADDLRPGSGLRLRVLTGYRHPPT